MDAMKQEAARHEAWMKAKKAGDTSHPITKVPDMVNSPPHYNSANIETIDAIRAATGDGFHFHLQGTILKYLHRYRHKGNPLTDLRKARWYLDRLIEEYE